MRGTTFGHWLGGACPCGTVHGSGVSLSIIEDVYSYRDEDYRELFQVIRFAGKRFAQRRYAPEAEGAKPGGFVWNRRGVKCVLFQLPELLWGEGGREVVVVEGEKDALALGKLGILATCNPGGAGGWHQLDPISTRRALSGRRVTIWADRDAPGRKHALEVRQRISSFCAVVGVFESAIAKDAADHIRQGGDIPGDLVPLGAHEQRCPHCCQALQA